MTLSADGLSVECVADGRAALNAARADPPALLIADATLPGIDGYGLAEALLGEPQTTGTMVLLLTPDYAPPDLPRMMHVGIHDALTRPFEQHALLERVRGPSGTAPAPEEPRRTPTTADRAPAATPTSISAAELETLVERAVRAQLPALVEAALAEAVSRLTEAAVAAAVDDAVANALRDPTSIALGPRADAAIQAAAREVVQEAVAERGHELIGPAIEPVVWRAVPAVAEDLVREEIRRLTQEDEP